MKKKHSHSASKNRVSANSNSSSQNQQLAQPKGSACLRKHKVAMADTGGGAPTDPTPTRVWTNLKQKRTKTYKNPAGEWVEVEGPDGYLSPPRSAVQPDSCA